jgi:hypothetical protein
MSESLNGAMQFLLADGYVIRSPQEHYMFTNKFYKEFTHKDIGAVVAIAEVRTETTIIKVPNPEVITNSTYMQFILDAKVPKRLEGSNNEVYEVNQYSEKGAKAFRALLKSGEVSLDLLTKSTLLYYKGPGFKQKIGNYIGDGTWRTAYHAMVDNIGKNTLKEHIKEELHHDTVGTSKYQFREQHNSQSQTPSIGGPKGKKPWNSDQPKQLK